MRLAIIGSGDLGRSIAWYATQNGYLIIGFYDDFQRNKEVDGYSVLGTQANIVDDFHNGAYDALVCAIGYNHLKEREAIFNKYHYDYKIPFASIIDKSCHVDPSSSIGDGVVMFPGSFVDKGVVLEDNVLLNVCVTIAHDTKIKAHTFVSPRVAIAGFTTIGRRCMLGINSTVIDNTKVCDDVRLGGGTLVINNLDRPGLYVGTPAVWKKE